MTELEKLRAENQQLRDRIESREVRVIPIAAGRIEIEPGIDRGYLRFIPNEHAKIGEGCYVNPGRFAEIAWEYKVVDGGNQ